MTILAIIIFAGSLALSLCLTAVVKRWATGTDFVARPAEDRYHRSVIALGGGIAIFATIATVLLAGIAAVYFLIAPSRFGFLAPESVTIHVEGFMSRTPHLLIVIAALFLLHVVGLVDDKKHLGPFVKLAAQFIAAFILAGLADIRVELFIENKIVTTMLSAVWIVLIMNAFNFLDNMDGLCAGIAAIASSILLFAAIQNHQYFVTAFALIFIGTLLGFLIFNFPPAKIFMGDAGSLVVGAVVAILTLRTTYYQQASETGIYAVFVPLIVMAVPLYDFMSVTFIRISQGKSPFVGDTQHFSHRLRRRGLSDTQTALTLYLATLCTGMGAIFLYQVNLVGAILIFAQTVMILLIIAILEMTGKNDGSSD